MSERTLSALREFQASQPPIGGDDVKGQPEAEGNSSKEAERPNATATQPKTLQSIFADPNDDFDFEL